LFLVAVRVAVEPKLAPASSPPADASTLVHREAIDAHRLSLQQLTEELRDKRVVLVGETHFVNQTIGFLTDLVDVIEGDDIRLLLELPSDAQGEIDDYLAHREEAQLARLFQRSNALPYPRILRWAAEHRERVRHVVAMDEPRWRVVAMRVLATDTRNQTMADAIYREFTSAPKARVVAFGGAMHMLLAGRYMYDRANREPAGARLLRAGVSRHEIASILLSGEGRFALDGIWPTLGAVRIKGELAALSPRYFYAEAIFGNVNAGDLFDYFANLGKLTPVEGRAP
jgi:hypothetical protein